MEMASNIICVTVSVKSFDTDGLDDQLPTGSIITLQLYMKTT